MTTGDDGSQNNGDERVDDERPTSGPQHDSDERSDDERTAGGPQDEFEEVESTDRTDPFAELDDEGTPSTEPSAEDRDPFASTESAPDQPSSSAETADTAGEGSSAGVDTDPDTVGNGDPTDPFAELATSTETDDPFADEDPFERMDVDEVDIDDVWASLDSEPSPTNDAVDAASGPDTRRDDVVDKRTYCQRCPHFTEPPETACTHEGTDIVEVLDFDEFRVRGCPMVEEDAPRFDRSG
ncbi:MAG: hypothetical protein PPP55_03305 [Halorubrum sp.]